MHLLINDTPVFGTMAGVAFLVIGLIARKDLLKLVGLWILLLAGLATIPTVITGHGAEEVVEHLPGVDANLIHAHEEAADLVYPFAILLGVASGAALVIHKYVPKIRKVSVYAVLGLAIVVAAMVSWTANLGGQIRHPEIRPGFDTREMKFDAR